MPKDAHPLKSGSLEEWLHFGEPARFCQPCFAALQVASGGVNPAIVAVVDREDVAAIQDGGENGHPTRQDSRR